MVFTRFSGSIGLVRKTSRQSAELKAMKHTTIYTHTTLALC